MPVCPLLPITATTSNWRGRGHRKPLCVRLTKTDIQFRNQ